MGEDPDREIEGEIVRVDAVRHLQGARGHAVGSTLFLLGAGCVWVVGESFLAWVLVVVAFLLSANGLSIWAWDRLRTYFTPEEPRAGPDRALTVQPLSSESLSEMKAGAVMVGSFCGLLVIGNFLLELLGSRIFGALCAISLVIGNLTALVWSHYHHDER